MSFSYQNLWNMLERYHMNKTDLRQKLGLSTATLAKLSANQPVALEVLDKICEELGCSIGDVLTHQPDSLSPAAWSHIPEHQTHLLQIFFRLTPERTDYIYGFSTPYQMTEAGMEVWELSKLKELPDFLTLKGYLYGKQLATLLRSASEKKNIGQLLAEAGISLRLHRCTATEQDAIFSLLLCNGNFSYRPPFLLSTQAECSNLLPLQKPLQSFHDETMYCESLFGSSKQLLYTADGVPSAKELRTLWTLFLEHLPVQQNCNELARLNNFEVFTPLLPIPESEAAVSWNIDCKECKGKQIPEYISIRLDHRFLQGPHIVSVCAFNTANAFLDFCEQVYCGEQDIELRLPLQESVSYATVKVWKTPRGLCGTNLVYSSSHHLIRHFHLDMHLSTRSFQIEDEWSRRMEKEHKAAEKKGNFYSLWSVSDGYTDDETWLSEETQVQRDFQTLLGGYSTRSLKGSFFQEGSDKHIEFLAWFKKLLSDTKLHRIILIDPFITADSISKLLRSIGNTGVSYEIITDALTGSEAETRLNAIRSMKSFLDILNPGRLHIYAVNTSARFLHDRYLILLGKDGIPVVYVLTNSLDMLAQQHASAALPADTQLSREIFDYYVNAFSNFQSNGRLESLYASSDTKQPEKQQESFPVSKEDCTPEKFRQNLSSDLPLALASLAHMQPEAEHECFDYINSLKDASIAEKLSKLLEEYPESKGRTVSREGSARLLSVAQLLLLPFDHKGKLLQSAEHLFGYSVYEYAGNHCGWDIFFAAKLLWQLDPDAYCKQLLLVRQKLNGDRSFSNHRLFRLGAVLIGQLVSTLSFSNDGTALELLLHSELPLLRALAVTKLLSFSTKQLPSSCLPESVRKQLTAALSPKELLFSEVYLVQRLQIAICRKPERQEQIQPLIEEAINHMADGILSAASVSDANELFSNDDLYDYLLPLYSRNSEDICRLLQLLMQRGYLSAEMEKQLLIRLFFEKYKDGFSNSEVYFYISDLNESCMILEYLDRSSANGIASLKKEMTKLERQLGERLYHAFLKTKNYRLWKSSIDLFCCLVFTELWIARCYHQNPSRAVKEFERLSENFRTTLEKHSEVYNCLLQSFPELNA